jgi:hypothetical protein
VHDGLLDLFVVNYMSWDGTKRARRQGQQPSKEDATFADVSGSLESAHTSSYYLVGNSKRVVHKEGVFGYRGYERSEVKPLFPFGYGLSYRLSNTQISH